MRRLALAVAALVALLSATPAAAEPWCSAYAGDVLPAAVDVVWRGDLDGDGRRLDVVVRHREGCGTRECMYEAFVACRDGTFSSVMAPSYGDTVRVTRHARRGWARIYLRAVGESRDPAKRYAWIAKRFGADGYE